MSSAWLILALLLGDVVHREEPESPQVETAGLSHLMRGLHFLSRGHASAAVPHLRLALLYDPASPFIHAKLSEAWLQAGERQKAERIVEDGLALAPKDPQLNLRFGIFAASEKRYKQAIEPLSVASRVDERRGSGLPGAVVS
ncbi:MAG: tetratricopeptide repeat protein, partial [Myxococcota bacterium]